MEVDAGGMQQHDDGLLSTGVSGLDDVLGEGLKADAVAPVELPGAVLIVDDNRDAADSLAELLSLGGGRVEVAYSGGEALRAVFVNHFATAVLDIGLPDMDGFQLAQSIRQTPRGASMKLIALSGWGQSSDRQRASAASFDHHLLKPVDVGQLLALLTAENEAPSRVADQWVSP